MKNLIKGFFKDEDGIQTLEVVVILVILVSLAFLFKSKLQEWWETLSEQADSQITNIQLTESD